MGLYSTAGAFAPGPGLDRVAIGFADGDVEARGHIVLIVIPSLLNPIPALVYLGSRIRVRELDFEDDGGLHDLIDVHLLFPSVSMEVPLNDTDIVSSINLTIENNSYDCT